MMFGKNEMVFGIICKITLYINEFLITECNTKMCKAKTSFSSDKTTSKNSAKNTKIKNPFSVPALWVCLSYDVDPSFFLFSMLCSLYKNLF